MPDLVRDLVGLGVRVHAVEPVRISLEERLLGILREGPPRGETAMSRAMTALTVAGLTLREASRRRVVWALLVLTVVLLALSAWGFSKLIGLDTELGTMTSGEARLVASLLLNLIMFGMSLIAAIGTAFLAGPTLAGEVESGQALAILARPVRRSAVLLGKWLGLVAFGGGYVVLAGLAQMPRRPGDRRLLAAGTRPSGSRCSRPRRSCC